MVSPNLCHYARQIPRPTTVLMTPPPPELVNRTTAGGRAMTGAPRGVTAVRCASARAAVLGHNDCQACQGHGPTMGMGPIRHDTVHHFSKLQNFFFGLNIPEIQLTSKNCLNL
jgi:hypothetical protein